MKEMNLFIYACRGPSIAATKVKKTKVTPEQVAMVKKYQTQLQDHYFARVNKPK